MVNNCNTSYLYFRKLMLIYFISIRFWYPFKFQLNFVVTKLLDTFYEISVYNPLHQTFRWYPIHLPCSRYLFQCRVCSRYPFQCLVCSRYPFQSLVSSRYPFQSSFILDKLFYILFVLDTLFNALFVLDTPFSASILFQIPFLLSCSF